MRTRQMTANQHGIVYSGEWVCEGHFVRFMINENDTVTFTDTLVSSRNTASNSKIMSLDSAIEIQEKYIKLGYDKVS